MRLIVDNEPIAFNEGDSVLIAMLRADLQPTGGGCLCLGGDCPNCVATVDGVSYVRTCQTKAQAGMVVERHHLAEYPPLPLTQNIQRETEVRHQHCDVAVIGAGTAGQTAVAEAKAAGKQVVLLDTHQGQEVVGIYSGPLVVARTAAGMLQVHAKEEVVVATGAAEIQPIVPGSELVGLVTARAAAQLAQAGIDLGRVVAVGSPPDGVEAEVLAGELVRFEGMRGG